MLFDQAFNQFNQSIASIKSKKIRGRVQKAFTSAQTIQDVEEMLRQMSTKWQESGTVIALDELSPLINTL